MILMIKNRAEGVFNVASGVQTEIDELAAIVRDKLNCTFDFQYDTSKPDGQSTRVVDVKKILALGWVNTTPLDAGIGKTVSWFHDNQNHIRRV